VTFSVFDVARARPDDEALVVGGQRFTYAALAARVALRARMLQEQGTVASGAPVGLVCDQSLSCFEWLYALLALGVPLLPLHPRLTAFERELLSKRAGAALTLDARLSELVAPPASGAPFEPAPAPVATRVLGCVPSSGTSGQAKLVRLSRGAFYASARADSAHLGALPGDRALLCLPLSHVGGLSIVTRALLAQRPVIAFTPGPAGLLGSLGELCELIVRERVSLLSLVPAVLERLLRSEPHFIPPRALRAVLLGGAACSPELYAHARERGLPVLPSYGLTETASQVVTSPYPIAAAAAVRHGVVSSGFPLAGVELRISDQQIELRGPMLCAGYLGEPSPFDDQGWLRTRDRAELDPELGLFVLGRASELIISGGENVDPVEVEHALTSVPGISAACVFGVEDPTFGEVVAAVVETDAASGPAQDELLLVLGERLASFKQPRLWTSVASLPRLASGKLDRRACREQAAPALRPLSRAK
jgi:O-succinylbenzoic acid--CoA ligase